jgi:hypothetical protein
MSTLLEPERVLAESTLDKKTARGGLFVGVADGVAHGAIASRAIRPRLAPRLALANCKTARATCASPPDSLVEPGGFSPPPAFPNEKATPWVAFSFGVADGAAHGAIASRAIRPRLAPRLALANCKTARTICASPPDSLVEPGGFSPPPAFPNEKATPWVAFSFGVADGVRTHDNWNHNPGLYR